MTTKKTASKVKKKASINFEWNFKQPNNKKKNKAKKELKKLSASGIILMIFCLGFGAVGGFFGVKVLTKNDCFILNGAEEITLELEKRYTDEGAKVVAFNKDISASVEIETNLNIDEDGKYYAEQVGTYYMVYKSNSIKYNSVFKIQKIRLITFVEASEGGNYEE